MWGSAPAPLSRWGSAALSIGTASFTASAGPAPKRKSVWQTLEKALSVWRNPRRQWLRRGESRPASAIRLRLRRALRFVAYGRRNGTLKIALITGITGQDGSYMAELLLSKGYTVHGIVRRASTFNTDRIEHLHGDEREPAARVFLHYGDLADGTVLRRIIEMCAPDEIYHLGAQSHVRVSFDEPEYTADVVALGTLRLLESVRDYAARTNRQVRVYQAGSSEMFGASPAPQSERTPFYPRSPYAVGKVAAHWFAVNYREAYGMFVCNGILFNHESPRRGETFVTRKITRALGRIKAGLIDKLYLGNLEARRDWGFAGDYVEAMWLMLQQERPDDYVIA